MKSNLEKTLYAIVDIETTGGDFKNDRITEIAIAVHDGNKVIRKFESLVNPQKPITPFVQNLTGITNDMVENAPHFFEIAKDVVEITEGAVFVAHNVGFDYTIIKRQFEELGYTYSRKKMCTAKLAKKFFPELPKHSLSFLIDHLGITVENRHRAMDDVLATVVVFEKMLTNKDASTHFKEFIDFGTKTSHLPDGLDIEDLHDLPSKSGVYFFYGENDHLLYVGKANNIKKRVFQHFRNHSKKSFTFLKRVKRIDTEVTGSELIALIKEDYYIKTLMPEYNKAQRGSKKMHAIYTLADKAMPEVGEIQKLPRHAEILIAFPRKKQAQEFLSKTLLEAGFCLCQENMKIPFLECEFSHSGQCQRNQSPNLSKAEKMQNLYQKLTHRFEKDFILLDKGKDSSESSIILIKKGNLSGYGYFHQDSDMLDIHSLDDYITVLEPSIYYNKLVRRVLSKNHPPKIHYLN